MRGGNFEDTLKMALNQVGVSTIDAIKEVDEECYDNSNYNSRTQFEPLNQPPSQGGSKLDGNTPTNVPREDKSGDMSKENPKVNIGSNEDDQDQSEISQNPIMTVVGPTGNMCKNVMNNISQTTKIIINNIGGDFKKKREKTDPLFESKVSDKDASDVNHQSFRADKGSGERRSWVNYNFSRPISKRSSEDPSQNEFIIKELPRRTSSSIENSTIFRRNEGEERNIFMHEFGHLRRASFREYRDRTLDLHGNDSRDPRRVKRSIHNADVISHRRPRLLSSTIPNNVIGDAIGKPRKGERLDIRSCLFGGVVRRPEGTMKEVKRNLPSLMHSFRK